MDAMRALSKVSSMPRRLIVPRGDGWRDVASAALFDLPGRWAIVKYHGRVRCFNRNRRVLWISSSIRSPRIFVRGLWSVTTRRSSHPSVKYLVCSRPQATAKASPSIGAYRVSASWRKREPASVIFQPVWQQLGNFEEQRQCCQRRKYPVPFLDQSGRKHVLRLGSNISTPWRIAAMMASLD